MLAGDEERHTLIRISIASIMHYTLVLSPEGPTMLRMLSSVHNLIPYTIIRQTLKVGNVATMLSGVMRIVLAKASVATVTNWIGLSSGADEGMNLMQQFVFSLPPTLGHAQILIFRQNHVSGAELG